MTTFLPKSVNFMFKRLGPFSGAIMGTLLRTTTCQIKEPPSKGSQERASEAALVPDTAWLRTTPQGRALSNRNLVNFDQSSSSNKLILNVGRLLSARECHVNQTK